MNYPYERRWLSIGERIEAMRHQPIEEFPASVVRPCVERDHEFLTMRANIASGCVWFTYCHSCDKIGIMDAELGDDEEDLLRAIGRLGVAAFEKLNSKGS